MIVYNINVIKQKKGKKKYGITIVTRGERTLKKILKKGILTNEKVL